MVNLLCCKESQLPYPVCGKGCKVIRQATRSGPHLRTFCRLSSSPGNYTIGSYRVFIHDDCKHNQAAGLYDRVLAEVNQPTPEALAHLRKLSKRVQRQLGRPSPGEPELLSTYHVGRKRRLYEEAARSVRIKPVERRDAKLQSFVKKERMSAKLKSNPAPRIIQSRTPRYNVVLAQYLKPLEEKLYELKGFMGRRGPLGRLFGKSLNSSDRAKHVLKKWKRFRDPVCVSLDLSRMDQHVAREILQVEHDVYIAAYNQDPFLRRILSWQLDNVGSFYSGLKYVTNGRRCSGDMNTALGNCLLMALYCSAIMADLDPLVQYDLFIDGDDTLLFMEKEEWIRLLDGKDPSEKDVPIKKVFENYGQVLKIDNIAYRLTDILWCQAKLVERAPGDWTFVRDPRKVMESSLCGTKFYKEPFVRKKLLTSIGYGLLAAFNGIPLLQEYALALIRIGGNQKWDHWVESMEYWFKKEIGFRELYVDRSASITDTCRVSFEEALGISVHDQYLCEEAIRAWDPPLDGDSHAFDELILEPWIWLGDQP